MPQSLPDDSLFLVRCPSCRQRFKVDQSLRGRSVECGACEHRFRIEGDAVVRGPKAYPGERSSDLLNRFQRVPLSGLGATLPGTRPISYATPPDPVALEPTSPLRVIAGAFGVAGMAFIALLLMFSSERGSALDGMTMTNRLVMTSFTGLTGVLLLIYANPKARLKALGIGLGLAACLTSVPFFFREGSVPLASAEVAVTAPAGGDFWTGPKVESEISRLSTRIGTQPLEKEIERMAGEGNGRRAAGLWLRGLSNNHRYLVRDYILRVTNADPTSHAYPRDGGDYLFVLTGIRQTLQELAQIATVLGESAKIYPEISVIEVRVNSESFVEGPIEKLKNKDDPDFYALNKRELESIDLERAKRAVQRLADAEPKVFRSDITRKLIGLLGEEGVSYKANICEALEVWAEIPGPAGDAAVVEIEKLMKQNQPVPVEMVALPVKEQIPAVIPLLDELWVKEPLVWESLYRDAGPAAEPSVLRRFPETSGNLRYSALRILSRVGGEESLRVIGAISPGGDSELRVLIEQATKSIGARLNK